MEKTSKLVRQAQEREENDMKRKAAERKSAGAGARGPMPASTFEFTTKLWKNAKAPLLVLVSIWQCLLAQRDAGVPMPMPIIAPLILGILMANGITWKPSRSWMWNFVTRRCNLTVRAGTQDARKIPDNYAVIRKFFILRFVWLAAKFLLRPSLIYNFDESGCVFFPVSHKTYNKKGAKDVPIQNIEEKRQFTITPIISMCGRFISKIQIIWQGDTMGSCPKSAIRDKTKDQINHTYSTSHWSVSRTVIELVDSIYEDDAKSQLNKLDAEAGAAGSTFWCIVLDVYSSHISKETIETLKAKYPTLILYFVPPSCTPVLQPLDIGFNGWFKRFLSKLAMLWFSNWVADQIRSGAAACSIRLDKTKAFLAPVFCDWVSDAVIEARKTEVSQAMILKTWGDDGAGLGTNTATCSSLINTVCV
jgi:hypothetical protein